MGLSGMGSTSKAYQAIISEVATGKSLNGAHCHSSSCLLWTIRIVFATLKGSQELSIMEIDDVRAAITGS